ncbi:SMP-30/gluconolactonase/LRE family protein [Oceanomicrobium pacificus]|uniref:SMP-30/gluconolactonase/LRE family protein n=1 Tax=Oceanomicrobium pacificus TaxID=2692916 RepID=A0A6B0TVM1_9RHOB|nr:SMP-30/gluconolactonase/LRE family protein [Oceanomicrobium pacificus]MXU65033.1 SMP-30/gluconolactonase/LRE family protein [Oceanomicrobium pacificus]
MAVRTGDYVIHDDRFCDLILGPHVAVEQLWDGGRWTEGPVWFGDAGHLLWSDIPNNRIMRWTEDGVSTFRAPSGFANGHTRDLQGRLVSCEHGPRRVTRTEFDGTVTVLADSFAGKRLNSPNDVVVAADGAVWFTDPDYGILTDFEGHAAAREQSGCFLFRLDLESGDLAVMADDFAKPNGLAFSPDGQRLYVADTGRSHDPEGPGHIRAFDVGPDGLLSGGKVFAAPDRGLADGFRCDLHGNLWSSAGDGVHCFAPDGTCLGRILIPQVVSNCTFGGPARNRLFITATTGLYAVFLNTRGAGAH